MIQILISPALFIKSKKKVNDRHLDAHHEQRHDLSYFQVPPHARSIALWMFQYWPDNIQAQYLDDIEMPDYDDVLSMTNVIHR